MPSTPDVTAADLPGAWILERAVLSCRKWTVDVPTAGLLVYSADGYVSVALRMTLRRSSRHGKSMAYAGPFTVDGSIVVHHIEISTWPFRAGRRMRRWASMRRSSNTGDELLLSNDPRRLVRFRLEWRRSPAGGP